MGQEKEAPLAREGRGSQENEAFMFVYRSLLEGHNKANVLEALVQNYPDIDHRAVLVKSLGNMIATAQEPKELALGWAIEALKEVYRKANTHGDLSGALQAIKELIRITEKNPFARKREDFVECQPSATS